MSLMHSIRMSMALLLLACFPQPSPAQTEPSPAVREMGLFGPSKVWSIHLEMTADEFDAMQPPVPGAFGAPPPAENRRESELSLFGTEFRWAEAKFTASGQSLPKVGIRYAGDITYLVSASGPKRPLKIAFDKFDTQTLEGLSAVQLHAMPLDPSKAREALAYSVFRAHRPMRTKLWSSCPK